MAETRWSLIPCCFLMVWVFVLRSWSCWWKGTGSSRSWCRWLSSRGRCTRRCSCWRRRWRRETATSSSSRSSWRRPSTSWCVGVDVYKKLFLHLIDDAFRDSPEQRLMYEVLPQTLNDYKWFQTNTSNELSFLFCRDVKLRFSSPI